MKISTFQERIGDAVRKRRRARKFSQENFADRIGMHRAYYGAIERGKKNLQLSTLKRVCDGLDVAIWEVIREAESR